MHGIHSPELRSKCNAIAPRVEEQELNYEQLARQGELYQWASHGRSGDNESVIGDVTRGNFKVLYNGQLVRKGSHARHYYDQLKISSRICPYCGFGTVETLDHFLPKAHYSSLSVLPLNLVPACSDCNKKKHETLATAGNISSHPYFEAPCVFDDEWLRARIVQLAKPSVEFYVTTPEEWVKDVRHRVVNHFENFQLAGRYAIQAVERLMVYACAIDELVKSEEGDVIAYLHLTKRTESRLGVNSWQAALATAVASDVWFHTEGYRSLL